MRKHWRWKLCWLMFFTAATGLLWWAWATLKSSLDNRMYLAHTYDVLQEETKNEVVLLVFAIVATIFTVTAIFIIVHHFLFTVFVTLMFHLQISSFLWDILCHCFFETKKQWQRFWNYSAVCLWHFRWWSSCCCFCCAEIRPTSCGCFKRAPGASAKFRRCSSSRCGRFCVWDCFLRPGSSSCCVWPLPVSMQFPQPTSTLPVGITPWMLFVIAVWIISVNLECHPE